MTDGKQTAAALGAGNSGVKKDGPGEGIFRFGSKDAKGSKTGRVKNALKPGEALRRPGQDIGDRRYEKALDMLDEKRYSEALDVLNSLSGEFPEGSFEAMAVAFNIAETHFFNKSLDTAKAAYSRFLEKYPDSPFADNARAAIDFIGSFDKYQAMYVSPDDMGEGGKR